MPILAFLTLGFLIGNLLGLSSDSVVKTIIPLLFAFGGGSAIGFLHKLEDRFRTRAYQLIFVVSISCLFGTYSGIIMSEYQLLSPNKTQVNRAEKSIKDKKYLFSGETISKADEIDQLYSSGLMEVEDAYESLYKIISQRGKTNEN